MRFDSLVFDLDGTLWDTCPACAIGWNNVLRRHSITFREITADDVRAVTGKPHEQCIREVFAGLPEAQLQILIHETMTEDNEVITRQGGILYPGVKEGLVQLSNWLPLYIVSNCQAGYIETFLKWSGFSDLFCDFECWGNTGLSKSENLESLVRRNGLMRPLFIGDTAGDALAAKACDLPFAFVKYGFGQVDEYDFSATEFNELCDIIRPPST